MATPQAATTANGTAKTRRKGADLDARVEFVDAKNQRTKSIPAEPHTLVVIDKSGKSGDFNLRELPPATLVQLAASDIRRRVKLFKADAKPILEQVAELFAAAKGAKLFAREVGATRGRSFDVDLYHRALVMTYNHKAQAAGDKPLPPKEVTNLRAQIEGYSKEMRVKAVDKWTKDAVFKVMMNKVKAERGEAVLANASGSAKDLLAI